MSTQTNERAAWLASLKVGDAVAGIQHIGPDIMVGGLFKLSRTTKARVFITNKHGNEAWFSRKTGYGADAFLPSFILDPQAGRWKREGPDLLRKQLQNRQWANVPFDQLERIAAILAEPAPAEGDTDDTA